jgi:hypothetical protein
MTLPDPDNSDALLAARYLDGTLSPAEHAAFTARLTQEPALAAYVQELQQVDAALQVAFAPSSVPLPAAPVSHIFTTRRIIALAATIALVGLCVWLLTAPLRHPSARLYAREQANNFTPQIVCTTPEEFATWTHAALQQAMTPGALPASVQLIGWDYAPEMQYYTCVLIAQTESTHILVTLDRLDREEVTIPPRTQAGNLHIYERILGDVRLREITPFDQPRIIPFLEQTTLPPQPTPAPGTP